MSGTREKSKKGCEQGGFVLVVSLIIMLMLSLIGIASIMTSNTDMQVAGNEFHQTGAFYAAEAGLEKATSEIKSSYETAGLPPNPLPGGHLSLNYYNSAYRVVDQGPAVTTTLSNGAYTGLYGMIKSFQITSSGFDDNSESAVVLEMGVEDALIPLFQFAVFYEEDLEIAPGATMTLGGRVHSNKNIYMQSSVDLYIDSYVTSAGNILHGRKPGGGSVDNGDVFIRDSFGIYQNMKNPNGTFLDSQDGNWVDLSQARWGGNVEDVNHGFTELNMPVVCNGPTTNLIDRGAGNPESYENKAGLKLVDGQALYLQADGSWLNVTGSLIAAGAISAGTFYDGREISDVNSLDIDISALNASGYFPTNGIIYASGTGGTASAIRLKNGSQLPAGLTVATDNPLYTIGDYNTINKRPAALMSDALTILSNNWNDANSWSNLAGRPASNTRVNASYVTGNVETGVDGNGYNGGLENLPRFLENWTGSTLAWRGSAVDLWYSRQATGAWSYGSYYTAPIRDWAYDPSLMDPNNLPPGTPQVNIVLKTGWKQSIVVNYVPPSSLMQ